MSVKEIVIASVFFLLLTLIFFHKIFFGLIPLPTDLIVGAYYPWLNHKWGDYIVGVPVQNPKLSDAVSLYYPFKSLTADLLKKGELPLWNSYMFGGYPLLANVQAGLLFPTIIFYLIFSAPYAWTLQVMSQPFLASIFMYLLLRHFKLGRLPSVFGSIVYGFGGSTILWIQWNTQATTSLFLPILILLQDKYLTLRSVKWGALLSFFICLQILAGYLPVLPFTFIALALWFIFRFKSLADLKIIFFFFLGLSLSAIFLLPVFELIRISQRTIETLLYGSPFFAPENIINLVAPDFFGNPATGNFWGKGDNMDTTIYAGVTALIFSLVGIKSFFGKPQVRFALCLFVIALLISTPNPLGIFLYKLGIWGGQSITMNRVNFLLNFSLAILGSYGISLFKNPKSVVSLKPAIWVLSAIAGLTLGLITSKNMMISISEAAPLIAKINISLRNLILPIILATTVFLLILVIKKFKWLQAVAIPIFTLVLIFELFRFGLKFNAFSSIDFLYPETPISKFLKQYPHDRVIAERDIFPANMWLPFKISSIQGYDGIYPLKTAKLLSVIDSDSVDAAPKPRWGLIGNFNSKILDETNTRFLLAIKRGYEGRATNDGQVAVTIPGKYKEIFAEGGVAILENTQSLPRVYLTKKAIKASDRDTLQFLIDADFPIREISIADNFEYNNDSEEKLNANLEYIPVTNNHVQIKTSSNIDAYLVLLDSFYPGWKASIDGKESTIYRTNYNFRGIVLPKGNHIVDFIYFPKSLQYGMIISVASLVIIISLLCYRKKTLSSK